MAKHPTVSEHDVIAAAFDLAADQGWRGLSLAELAVHAKLPLASLVDLFPTKLHILDGYARQLDRQMMEGGFDKSEGARDRLFDVVMRRFDAMAPHRKALRIILRDSGEDPWAVMCGARRFAKSMALTLETAGISSNGLAGMARVQGLAVAYLYVLRIFLDDDSADLARTMAALDSALRRAEDVAALVWRRPVVRDKT